MSDIETSMPTRAEILSVIGGLEALSPAPSASPPAAAPSPPPASLDAQARHDQDAAAFRDMTADRDAWQSAAERLQTELWRQMDVVRSELDGERAIRQALGVQLEAQRIHGDAMRAEIAHLSAAISSLLELATARSAAAPTAPASRFATTVAESSNSEGYAVPAGLEARPSTQPPPPPVDPNAAPMVIPSIAPDLAPPVKRKPIRAVQPVAPRVQAEPEPAADPVVEDLPPVVEFTAPEPDVGIPAIAPTTHREKKRRLRIG